MTPYTKHTNIIGVCCIINTLYIFIAGFTLEMTETEITDYEGAIIALTVRLEGQLSGAVEIELLLLTVSQFQNRPEGDGFIIDADPAESEYSRNI